MSEALKANQPLKDMTEDYYERLNNAIPKHRYTGLLNNSYNINVQEVFLFAKLLDKQPDELVELDYSILDKKD